MKPLLFILRKHLKNSIKELKKKPIVMIVYILILAFFVLMPAISFLMPSGTVNKLPPELFGAIVSIGILAVVYFGIKQGISSGSSFFRLSDVNFVFTAPISPKKVLIYGFLQQLFMTFFIVLFISFQIPNLKNNFPIKSYGVFIIYAGVVILFFTIQLIGMLIYSISSKSSANRKLLQRIFTALVAIFAGGFLIAVFKMQDVKEAAIAYLNNDLFSYIPFIGWVKEFLMAAVYGMTPLFYLNLFLILFSSSLAIFVVYKLKTDYYEDVLAATERKEQMIAAKRAGRSNLSFRNVRARKVSFKFEGTGARSIFYRHILEYRKNGLFFLNRTSFIVIAAGLASKYFYPGSSIMTTMFFSIYLLFFVSIQGKWVDELNKQYIYLIPDKSSKKVFYATLSENIKNLVDGILLFTAAGIMFKSSVLTIVLCVLAYVSFGSAFSYGDVLSRRLFGKTHSKNLQVFVRMFITLGVITPAIIFSFISKYLFGDVQFYCTLIAYNLLVSFAILMACKGIF
ncbi:MAG TPA: putative ABC exporter domain-containing protein, partial [Clostridia bacterium]|nr:putative ABC exporter domain-containing protein [Clostridia bacterium]